MNSRIWRMMIAVVVVAVLRIGGSAQSRTPQTLAVPGAANATPSLAVSGRPVAAVWTATKDGSANVYLPTSTDGGASFSPPRRVNDQDGDAGATNEQPPRVVILVQAPLRHSR